MALYNHVRREAAYVRYLERGSNIRKTTVARLIAELERDAFRRRLGDELVRRRNINSEQDRKLSRLAKASSSAATSGSSRPTAATASQASRAR